MRGLSTAANSLLPDEAAARRLLLARALDEADAQGRLVGPTEKQQAEDEALQATSPAPGKPPADPLAWLLERSSRIAGLLEHRSPALAALAHPPAWQVHAGWLLPLLALAAGALIDRIDNPRQVNLLSPPLLAFLLWNLAVYVLLLVHAVWPRRGPRKPSRVAFPWRPGGARGQVAAVFQRHWWAVAGTLQAQRWRRILHTAAAAWGVGVALSIVLGGLVREYRVGWESTLLDLPQVHAVLHWMFAPVGALLGIEPFSLQEVARLHFGSGDAQARPEARRWVALYLGLIGFVVVGPRAVLAAWAAVRERWAARTLRVDVDEPYYAALLSRVTPGRVRIAVLAASDTARERVDLLLQQAGGNPRGGLPWVVLTTARGDTLQVVEAVPVASPVTAVVPRSWWRAPDADVPQRRALDAVLLACDAGAVDPQLLQQASDAGVPVLGLGTPAGTCTVSLPWHDLPTWHEDHRWWRALAQACPAHLRAGIERLQQRADAIAQERLQLACQLLAGELVLAVRDEEVLPAPPAGVRQLLVRAGREEEDQARGEAAARLLQRLDTRRRDTDARLLALHGLVAVAQQDHGPLLPDGVRTRRAVDAPQAGIAGAASGAAMGATVDLVTGGLTLGAASALGALVGGGAALAAAAWRNARGEAGRSSVALDDAVLAELVRQSLLRYLAVVHGGRAEASPAAVQGWRSALDAAEAPLDAAQAALREARAAPSASQDNAALEAALRDAVAAVLQRLHG
jgi:hypothetical protein